MKQVLETTFSYFDEIDCTHNGQGSFPCKKQSS